MKYGDIIAEMKWLNDSHTRGSVVFGFEWLQKMLHQDLVTGNTGSDFKS